MHMAQIWSIIYMDELNVYNLIIFFGKFIVLDILPGTCIDNL